MIDEHASLSEKFIKKGFWLYLFTFIIAPLGYLVKIIVSNQLSVEEVGIVYGVLSLIVLLGTYNDLGLTESLNYFLPKYIVAKDYVRAKAVSIYALAAQLSTSIIIGRFLLWGNDYIALHYFHHKEASDVLFIFAFYFFGNNIFAIVTTFFSAIQNTFYQKLVELIRMGFTLILTFSVWYFGVGDIRTFSQAWVGGLYIGGIFARIIFIKKYYIPYFSKEKILLDMGLFKEIFSYAMMIMLASQASVILSQIDMQMIIYMLGVKDAGYYTNYLSIIGIPFIVIGPIFAFLFPVFSEMHSKKDFSKITTIRQIFTKYFTVIAIICSTLFFVFGPIIAYILFGEKFEYSGVILQYSIFFLVFNFLLQINFNILGGTGRVKERVKIISWAILANIITNYVLIKLIGVVGASLATGLGWLLIYVLSEKLLYKEYKLNWDYKFIGKNIILSLLLGLLTWIFLIPLFDGLGRGISFLYMIIYTIVYSIFFGILNKSEFSMFIGEIKKIRKK